MVGCADHPLRACPPQLAPQGTQAPSSWNASAANRAHITGATIGVRHVEAYDKHTSGQCGVQAEAVRFTLLSSVTNSQPAMQPATHYQNDGKMVSDPICGALD